MRRTSTATQSLSPNTTRVRQLAPTTQAEATKSQTVRRTALTLGGTELRPSVVRVDEAQTGRRISRRMSLTARTAYST